MTTSPDNTQPVVFLCHAVEDKPKVRSYAARLRHAGFQVWFDEDDLLPGADWKATIASAIKRSDAVVVFLSSQSQKKRGYVQAEVDWIIEEARRQPENITFVVPAKLEPCPLPERLAKWQSVDLWSADGFRKLCMALDTHRRPSAASHLQYLRKFFLGVDPSEEATVVTASHRHALEGYSSKPDCDMRVANQIRIDLEKIDVRIKIMPDDTALKQAETYRAGSLLLVCGPIGNRFTRHVYENWPALNSVFRVTGDRSRTLFVGGQQFVSHDPLEETTGRVDHAFIGRFKNPWKRDRYVFLFFGLQPIGTSAIAQFLERQEAYERLTRHGTLNQPEEIAFVLPVHYSTYDGDNCHVQLGEETRVL